jgi:hypothetical protein
MSKQNYAEPGKCTRCKHQDATHAHECRQCHYVTLTMTIVHSIWSEDELESLAEDLNKVSTQKFIEDARERNAYKRTMLGYMISRLSHPAHVHRDELKRSVVKAIREYVGEMQGIRDYEAKPGNAGAWKRHTQETIASWVGKATHAKI